MDFTKRRNSDHAILCCDAWKQSWLCERPQDVWPGEFTFYCLLPWPHRRTTKLRKKRMRFCLPYLKGRTIVFPYLFYEFFTCWIGWRNDFYCFSSSQPEVLFLRCPGRLFTKPNFLKKLILHDVVPLQNRGIIVGGGVSFISRLQMRGKNKTGKKWQ